jgi:DNA-binding MarR family transcriptional regulator
MSKDTTGDRGGGGAAAGAGEHDATVRSLARLDPVLQHRSRLGACVLLSTADALSFSRLRELLDETDGNLGAQLRKLEEVGYLTVKKEFAERKPVSWYSLTAPGQRALRSHLTALEAVIRGAQV